VDRHSGRGTNARTICGDLWFKMAPEARGLRKPMMKESRSGNKPARPKLFRAVVVVDGNRHLGRVNYTVRSDQPTMSREKVIKRCPKGHRMELSWMRCPRCGSRSTTKASARSMTEATIFASPEEPLRADRTYIMSAHEVAASVATPRLVALAGPLTNQELSLAPGRTRVGKEPDEVDGEHRIPIAADRYLSKVHAVIEFMQGQVTLIDSGSTNGCYVNGRRVERVTLRTGDRLQLGETVFRFEQAP
jgi:hypothetical protein